MFLTVEDGAILGPVCWLFGNIFELMYKLIQTITPGDVANLSICVILFTVFIRGCLFPLNFKQQKSSKVMKAIQPEINKATKKYNNKTDQESMLKKQQITTDIQKKYGVSMTSGCLPTLIQLPVFYGLYRVIQNIPAYVSSIYDKYDFVVNQMKTAKINTSMLSALSDFDSSKTYTYVDIINSIASDKQGEVSTAVSAASTMMKAVDENGAVINNKVIDVLDKISQQDWNQLVDMFDFGSSADKVNTYVGQFETMNKFLFGLNIADAPGFKLSIALIIPILSAVLQFVSSKISQSSTADTNDPAQKQANSMMNMMTIFMPVMSLIICVSLPIAIGLYWIIGSVIAIVSQLIINRYYNTCDMDAVLEKCRKKAEKKQAKKQAKHPNKKSFYEKMMDAQNGNVSSDGNESGSINKIAGSRLKSYNNPTVDEVKQTVNNTKYKEGSLGAKANVMMKYQNNGSKNGGNK